MLYCSIFSHQLSYYFFLENYSTFANIKLVCIYTHTVKMFFKVAIISISYLNVHEILNFYRIFVSFSLDPCSENETCSRSIHVKSFDGDVRVFCVDCMSSCAHRQLGFRNHYPSKHCLTRPSQQTSDYMGESPTPYFICLHLIVQSQICSINI